MYVIKEILSAVYSHHGKAYISLFVESAPFVIFRQVISIKQKPIINCFIRTMGI